MLSGTRPRFIFVGPCGHRVSSVEEFRHRLISFFLSEPRCAPYHTPPPLTLFLSYVHFLLTISILAFIF